MNLTELAPVSDSLSRESQSRLENLDVVFAARLAGNLDAQNLDVVDHLLRAFRVPTSGIGLVALVHEIGLDLKMLSKEIPNFVQPDWARQVTSLANKLADLCATDPVRDLSALRDLPRQPLRDFLAPIGKKVSPSQTRRLRACRAILGLKILASKGELATGLTTEFCRWLAGSIPAELLSCDLTFTEFVRIASNKKLTPDAAKPLNQLGYALIDKLANPFGNVHSDSIVITKAHGDGKEEQADDDEDEESSPVISRDVLDDLLAAQAIATKRKFSGVSTFDTLFPFELEMIWPKLLAETQGKFEEMGLCAALALFGGLLPLSYHRVPIGNDPRTPFSLCASGDGIRFNLDKVIGHADGSQAHPEESNDRFVKILFPAEVARLIAERILKNPSANFLDQLFDTPVAQLKQVTRKFLRDLSLSSHCPTLTRLARTWGRYVLSVCRDETYASIISIDFTIGTTANFNYLTVLGERMKSILRKYYRKIGYSGDLPTKDLPDVRSLRLPSEINIKSFVSDLTSETSKLIAQIPRRCPIAKLTETHNKIAVNIYVLFKFGSGSRPLEEETVTGSQLDLDRALGAISDKRVSPYHQGRPVVLPNWLVLWLKTYISWLESLAYRLSNIDPELAALIHSITKLGLNGDLHPLFFRFTDGLKTVALGSLELNLVLSRYGMENNPGRHFGDFVARAENIDSAAIMGHMGRANAGQELFGRWSAATPMMALKPVAAALDHWFGQYELAPPPSIQPRSFHASDRKTRTEPYLPKLLQSDPAWSDSYLPSGIASPEPCPIERTSISYAAHFPRLFQSWRNSAPGQGWVGVALSLIFEDGVVLESELLGAIAEIQSGQIYFGKAYAFVDSKPGALGIRRTNLSDITLRLAEKASSQPWPAKKTEEFLELPLVEFHTDSKSFSLRNLLASSEAFFSLSTPAVLSAWSRGLIFTRTTRPETVARHLFNVIEPPMFDLRRRFRNAPIVANAADAVAAARSAFTNGGSHDEAFKALLDTLNDIELRGSESPGASLQLGYLRALAESVDNFNTFLRYESGARSFVSLATRAIEEGSPDQIQWQQLVMDALSDRKADSPPDTTAINFVLDWLGVDRHIYQRTTAPHSARTYAEILSSREINIAENILLGESQFKGDERHIAQIVLRLLSQHPLRWDALAHVRLCDLALDCPVPHFVICGGAGAELKSDNAPSVHALRDNELARDLTMLCEIRRARFPEDELGPLFGDLHSPRSIELTTLLHDLITDALWRATGSPIVRIHDLRHFAITQSINRLFSAENQVGKDALFFRQALIECSVAAGQSCPQVSLEHYGHDFDVLRTLHFNEMKRQLTPPSDKFISAVTGATEATLRKRRSRDAAYSINFLEGFEWQEAKAFGAAIPLENFIAKDQERIQLSSDELSHRTQTQFSIYCGLRIFGDTKEVARAVSGLLDHEAQPIEVGLARALHRTGSNLRSRPDINRQRFLEFVLNAGITVAMSVVCPPRQTLARIERLFLEIGDEWRLPTPEDAFDLSAWVQVWRANGISSEFLLRPSGRSHADSERLEHARASGFTWARTLPLRHFPRGTSVILRFSTANNLRNHGERIRASPQAAFLLSASALAIIWALKGETI